MRNTPQSWTGSAIALVLFLFAAAGCAHTPSSSSGASGGPTPALAAARTEAPGPASPAGADPLEDLGAYLDEEEGAVTSGVADPLAPWNRAMFVFNDRFYFWVLKPVARGYRAVFPSPVRVGVQNFFRNLGTPARFANCVLQAKGRAAAAEITRFVICTTVGVLGFWNPVKDMPQWNPDPEDLGQTLAVWGVGNGFYIVWPFLGPSTLRDSFGKAGDRFAEPLTYVEPFEASLGIKAYEVVNDTSFRIGDYEALKESAIIPYEAFRDAYIQYRNKKIRQ